MAGNEIFNLTVCIIGIAILSIHIVNLLIKRNKRKDEKRLLLFLSFTAFHFATYLTFVLIKTAFTSNALIISFYTIFYIFNNVEALLLSIYMLSYVEICEKNKKLLSIIYYSLFAAFVVLDIINIFTHIFFVAIDGEYVRSKTMVIAQGYQFIMLAIVLIVTVFNKKLILREKMAFGCYCLLPLVAIVVQILLPGYAIAYASIIIAIEILFFFVNVSKNIQLAEEQQKNKEAQIRIMMSQIQPHFVYNSLSAISTLIPLDPEKAQKELDGFTEYLRHNLSSLTEIKLIPFEDELKHIETYVSLEKMRFNERVNVVYDIQTKDFNVPSLSVQPLVENAIKHGILKKVEGGTVVFKTYETSNAYVVEISDDGVGFSETNLSLDENKHFGINNIKNRLKTMCHGDLQITSGANKGTKAVVTFYK